MKRRNFMAALPAALAAASCNPRLDQREKRYDEKDCPFCVPKPGTCFYCNGTKKCSFCNGTGKRKTTTENYPKRNIEQVTIEEDCPYCTASGVCRHCDGVGKCWACKGTGKIEDWNFYDRQKAGVDNNESAEPKSTMPPEAKAPVDSAGTESNK